MTILTQVRPGAYYDSVVLMQVQRALASMPGVAEAGIVMGTPANKELLAASDLLAPEADAATQDDLIIAVRAENPSDAEAALAQVDSLFARKRSVGDDAYRPKTLDAALQQLPEARWALVSTPGRFAAGVAHDALQHNLNVFLYSDNVSLEDEIALKQEAQRRGLLVMGPDCGTAIINGVGLGFSNRVRRGSIGIIGASGTGIQYIAARIHQNGFGITHALGTGGRDLSNAVNATTALQALDLLRRDPATEVIVIISKPPSPEVAKRLVDAARAVGKNVFIHFIGHDERTGDLGRVLFVDSMDMLANIAGWNSTGAPAELQPEEEPPLAAAAPQPTGYLRGLFSGGTIAYEVQNRLRNRIPEIWSNAPLEKRLKLPSSLHSQGHTILDLGEDEFTVGRLHPMLDNELRIKRLLQEAADPECGAIVLDVVLGDGAHPDPAAELAPAIAQARQIAEDAGRRVPIFVLLVGTDEDPQDLARQKKELQRAGANVAQEIETLMLQIESSVRRDSSTTAVPMEAIHAPFAAINIGLESFAESLYAQGASVLQMDWKPPAGGNERLMGILSRMKSRSA